MRAVAHRRRSFVPLRRLRRAALVLLAGAVLPAAAAAADSGFSAEAAREKARVLLPAVLRADAGPLWPEFDDTMRAALGDSARFAATLSSMLAQTGSLDSLLSESVTAPQPGAFLYRALGRFAKFPQPLELLLGFDARGRVTGLILRPPKDQPRREYPSPHEGDSTRTALRPPVRGAWRVVWGGRRLAQNYHAFTRDQRFALDLLVAHDGRTHSGDGRALADYYAYGAPVLAPAAGTVVWAQDGLPDNPPGRMDPGHALGNAVVLDHGDGEFSVIAHLQPGSLRARLGARVTSADTIGLCGNSGNSSEPHVHYHLQDGPRPFDADGLPVRFVDVVVDGTRLDRAEVEQGQTVGRPE